jgi:hypothetical protein
MWMCLSHPCNAKHHARRIFQLSGAICSVAKSRSERPQGYPCSLPYLSPGYILSSLLESFLESSYPSSFGEAAMAWVTDRTKGSNSEHSSLRAWHPGKTILMESMWHLSINYLAISTCFKSRKPCSLDESDRWQRSEKKCLRPMRSSQIHHPRL